MMRLGTAGEAVYREHPIKILRYSAKNLWLLIFPLLRSLRFYPFSLQNLIDWGAGAWFDLLVALLILGIGTLRWHACTYYFDEVPFVPKVGSSCGGGRRSRWNALPPRWRNTRFTSALCGQPVCRSAPQPVLCRKRICT